MLPEESPLEEEADLFCLKTADEDDVVEAGWSLDGVPPPLLLTGTSEGRFQLAGWWGLGWFEPAAAVGDTAAARGDVAW